jgi:DNA-binding XRE family transcriptional regulator
MIIGEISCDLVVFTLNTILIMSKKQIPEYQRKRIEEISLFIACFIKNYRLGEGLTQREFAKLADVHYNSVFNIEHQKGINLITILKCIDAMDGMTVSEFFAGIE